MKEINRQWQTGRTRKQLTIRLWWRGNPLRDLWGVLAGRRPWSWSRPHGPVSASLRSGPHQYECYCDGRTNEFRLEVFGVGAWAYLSRNWAPQPCSCNKLTWLMFPDGHEVDIEDYGLERLQAEFPGVKAI